jgi:hypothetical protein
MGIPLRLWQALIASFGRIRSVLPCALYRRIDHFRV